MGSSHRKIKKKLKKIKKFFGKIKNSDVLFKKTKLKIEMLKLFIFKKVKVTKKFFGGKLKFTNKT